MLAEVGAMAPVLGSCLSTQGFHSRTWYAFQSTAPLYPPPELLDGSLSMLAWWGRVAGKPLSGSTKKFVNSQPEIRRLVNPCVPAPKCRPSPNGSSQIAVILSTCGR